MSVLPCGIIHFTLIPISQLKLSLNKHRDWGFQFPLLIPWGQTPLQDTGSAGQAQNRKIIPLVSQVLLLIGSSGVFSVYFWKIRSQARKWGNKPTLTEGLCLWLWGQQLKKITPERATDDEGLGRRLFFFFSISCWILQIWWSEQVTIWDFHVKTYVSEEQFKSAPELSVSHFWCLFFYH